MIQLSYEYMILGSARVEYEVSKCRILKHTGTYVILSILHVLYSFWRVGIIMSKLKNI